mgnify:CR=1 FL=1
MSDDFIDKEEQNEENIPTPENGHLDYPEIRERRETIETNRTRQNKTREEIQIPTEIGRNATDAGTTDETNAEKEIRYYK